MTPKSRTITDTDPSVDDVIAMLLAFNASPEQLEVLLISVTHGNVVVQSCLRNTLALFHVVEKEIEWRKSTGQPEGFEVMKSHKPIVAIGAYRPLQDEIATAEDIHGADGLHNVHNTYPHLTSSDAWIDLFDGDADGSANSAAQPPFFTASKVPSYKEILRILKENPSGTISILAMGPLTNVALAAAEDPETFLKVKVVPASTMPPAYPAELGRCLNLTLPPLDITTKQKISTSVLNERIKPFIDAGSPLARCGLLIVSMGRWIALQL